MLTIRNRPTFFIIGAPKCGTTALAQWLSGHPQVFMSARKEPHFFNARSMPATPTLAAYEALFANAGPQHRAIGEASTHYLFAPEAVPNILAYQPEARFIVCLRNPLQMAPSLHAECVAQGWDDETDFARAWALQATRQRGEALPGTVLGDPDRLQYGAYCQLGAQLARVYRQVPRERVLPLLLEDLREHPRQHYQRVLAFLGLDDDGRSQFPVVNAARATRWPLLSRLMRRSSQLRGALGVHGDWGIVAALRRLNSTDTPRPPLSAQMQDALRSYFADDVQQLGELLGRDLHHWLALGATSGTSGVSRRVTPGG